MSAPTTSGPPGPPPRPAGRSRWRALAGVTLAGAMVLAGCSAGAAAGDTGKQLTSWMTSSGDGAAVGQVEVDSRNIDFAIRDHNPPSAIKTVCALLTTDALTAIGNLPSPDQTLTDDLNHAFQVGSAAGKDCYDGATGDRSLLRRSAAERSELTGLLGMAVSRVTAVTGHAPSTSTTQAPNGCNDPFGC